MKEFLFYTAIFFLGAHAHASYQAEAQNSETPSPGNIAYGDGTQGDYLSLPPASKLSQVAGMMDEKSKTPLLDGRNPANALNEQDCDCCSYFKQAVYGEKYDSDGQYMQEGTKEWCRTKNLNRSVASSSSVYGTDPSYERAAAIRALNKHINREPILGKTLDKSATIFYSDLNRYKGNSQFKSSVGKLVGFSQGVFHNNQVNAEQFKKTWSEYRNVINNAPPEFISNPPSTILAYQELFESISQTLQQ